jgi:uncharacterized membrane protein
MTASKSSRARNARAQSNAARNRNAPAGRGTVAVKAQGRGDGTGQGRVTATRNGGPARGGSRAQVTWEEPADATSATGTAVPMWLQLTTFVLALAGLGVSTYLTVAHFTESALLGCSESGVVNCTKVTTSPQSYVFGIPVAILGLAFYVAAVALMSPWAWRSSRREVHLIRLASVMVGVGFVLYLIYAELFIIGSICLYCTSVHVITFLLFALTAFAAAVWGLDPARQR